MDVSEPPGAAPFSVVWKPLSKIFFKNKIFKKQCIDTLISQSLLYTPKLSNIWPALPIKWRVSQRWRVCFGLTRISLSKCLLWCFLLFPQWLRYPHRSGSISLLWPLYQTPEEPNLIPWSFLLSRMYYLRSQFISSSLLSHNLATPHIPGCPLLLHSEALAQHRRQRAAQMCSRQAPEQRWRSCRQAQNHFETLELEKLKWGFTSCGNRHIFTLLHGYGELV